jgi:hypothetical protein
MKICPTCNRAYDDETFTFCLDDGSILSTTYDPQKTERIPAPRSTDPPPTEVLYPVTRPVKPTPELHPTIPAPQPTPDLQPTIPALRPPSLYSDKPQYQSPEKRSGKTGLVIGVAVLLGIILGVGLTVSFLSSDKDNSTDNRSDSKISNTNVSPTSTPDSVIPTNTLTELPGERWQECETFRWEICGFWTRVSNGQWHGQWGDVRANLIITVNGKNVTATRRDLTESLQATYRGTLNAENTQITGTVDWCCDSLGNRSGTWRAQIAKPEK